MAARLRAASRLTAIESRIRIADIETDGRSDTEAMLVAVKALLDGPGSMLTIYGSHGNAKSLALLATVNEFLDRGVAALYVLSWDLFDYIQDAFNRDGAIKNESAQERINRYKEIPVLAIDEFQGAKTSDWRTEQLAKIVDYRQRQGLDGQQKTILAMNENPDQLPARIYSRIADGRNHPGAPIIANYDSDLRPLLRRKS